MQTGRVLGLSMGHFINDMYVGFLAPLLPLIIDKLGISITLAAGLMSILSIFTSLAQPAFAFIADKIRRPGMVILGPLMTAIFFSAIGCAHSYAMLVVVIILGGIGTAVFHPQAAAFVGKASGRQSGLAMSIFVTGGSGGYYMGPVVIMSIVTWLGLEYSFVSIGPGVLIAAILFFILPKLPHAPNRHVHVHGHVAIPNQVRAIIFLYFISMIRSFLISGFNTFIPMYLKEQRYSPMMYAVALTAFGIPGAVGSLFGGALSDRFGRRTTIFASIALSLPFFGLFLALDGLPSLVSLGVAGFAVFSSIPVVIIMAQELYPGRVNVVSSLVMGLSWGVAGVLVTPLGALAERIGLGQALTMLIFLGAISCILTLFLPETKKVKK